MCGHKGGKITLMPCLFMALFIEGKIVRVTRKSCLTKYLFLPSGGCLRLTCCAMSTVGTEYVLSWTRWSPSTTSTTPVAGEGLMT